MGMSWESKDCTGIIFLKGMMSHVEILVSNCKYLWKTDSFDCVLNMPCQDIMKVEDKLWYNVSSFFLLYRCPDWRLSINCRRNDYTPNNFDHSQNISIISILHADFCSTFIFCFTSLFIKSFLNPRIFMYAHLQIYITKHNCESIWWSIYFPYFNVHKQNVFDTTFLGWSVGPIPWLSVFSCLDFFLGGYEKPHP